MKIADILTDYGGSKRNQLLLNILDDFKDSKPYLKPFSYNQFGETFLDFGSSNQYHFKVDIEVLRINDFENSITISNLRISGKNCWEKLSDSRLQRQYLLYKISLLDYNVTNLTDTSITINVPIFEQVYNTVFGIITKLQSPNMKYNLMPMIMAASHTWFELEVLDYSQLQICQYINDLIFQIMTFNGRRIAKSVVGIGCHTDLNRWHYDDVEQYCKIFKIEILQQEKLAVQFVFPDRRFGAHLQNTLNQLRISSYSYYNQFDLFPIRIEQECSIHEEIDDRIKDIIELIV